MKRNFLINTKSFQRTSIQTEEAKTLKEASDYVAKETGLKLSIPTIFRILKKIDYSHQVIPYRNPKQKENLAEVIEFMERVSILPPQQLLATDECGHPLNLALRKG